MADDTARLIRALPDWAGPTSWVGRWAASSPRSLVVRHPRSLRRLVLAATGPRAPALHASLAGRRRPTPVRHEYRRRWWTSSSPLDQAAARNAWLTRVGRRKNFEQISAATLGGAAAKRCCWTGRQSRDRRSRTPGASGRGRSIGGRCRLDRLIPPANSRTLARAVRGARLKIYPDASHGFLFQEHAAFARALEGFLAAR